MKQLSQIIALFLFGSAALQIILGIGSIILFARLWANKISLSPRREPLKSKRELRRIRKEMESNRWIIE